MLRRVRWFAYGFTAGVGGSAYVLLRLRRMRARLTPRNVARAMALSAADLLEVAGRTIAPQQNAREPASRPH